MTIVKLVGTKNIYFLSNVDINESMHFMLGKNVADKML